MKEGAMKFQVGSLEFNDPCSHVPPPSKEFGPFFTQLQDYLSLVEWLTGDPLRTIKRNGREA